MKRILHSVVVATLAISLGAQAQQKPEFDASRLSEAGRQAYRKLSGAIVFRLGAVHAGQISAEERALITLLSEKEAVGALRSLVGNATPEGGLYGLLGLRAKDMESFRRQVELYKSQEGPPERALPPLRREDITIPRGHVVTQNESGFEIRPKEQIIGRIEDGEYDGMLRKDSGG